MLFILLVVKNIWYVIVNKSKVVYVVMEFESQRKM